MKVVHLPKKVEVGTYEFPIQIVSAGDARLDGDADGITYFGAEGEPARCILIAGRLGPKRTLDVVMHELTHAINWVTGVDDGTTEEGIADAHGRAWVALLLDNPRFVRWLNYVLERLRAEREDA